MIFRPKYRLSFSNSVNKIEFEEVSKFVPWKTKNTKLTISNQEIKISYIINEEIIKTFGYNDLQFISIKLKRNSIDIKSEYPRKINFTISSKYKEKSISTVYHKVIRILNIQRIKPIIYTAVNNLVNYSNDIPDIYSKYHPKYKYILNYEKNETLIIKSFSDLQLIKPSLKINSKKGLVKLKTITGTKIFEKKEILDFAINTGTNHFRYVDEIRYLVFGELILIDKKGIKHRILKTMGKSMEETNNIDCNKEHEIEYELLRIREKIISKIYST